MSLITKAKSKFQHLFASTGAGGIRVVTRAPARVNLIGDHTDYNQGLVLPMNVNREAIVVAERRRDDSLVVYSLDFEEKISAPIANLQYRSEDGWANYIKATLAALQNHGHRLEGMNLVVGGDIPHGAGLASSSALEAAVARAASALCGFNWDPLGVSKALQHGENDFIGVKSGLMDPLCVTAAKAGQVMYLDCRDNRWEDIPVVFKDAVFVVIDSGTSRSLKGSAYNERREQCEQGLVLLKKKNAKYKSLRDVSVIAFERYKKSLSPLLRKRVEHVVFENDRVKKAAQALKDGDSQAFGMLMNKSHRSMSALFAVSTDDIDSLVAYANNQAEVLGSRLTGGGFGGCTVNLVKKDQVAAFIEKTKRWFSQKRGMKATVISCDPSEPASELESEEPLDLASLGLG